MPPHRTHQHQPAEGSAKRERLFCLPGVPGGDLAKGFIMQNPAPPPWGPLMAKEVRDRLTTAGFGVSRCSCVEEHPVLQLRMRGSAELTTQEVVRRIRTLVRELGHRITSRGMEAYWRGGRFDGAFVMKADF